MCNHDENHDSDYLSAIDHPDYEVYRCECGALVNLRDPLNSDVGPLHAMTVDEINRMVTVLTSPTAEADAAMLYEPERVTEDPVTGILWA